MRHFERLSNIPEVKSINNYPIDDLSHCKYIYLDVGSNRGMHLKFLFQESKFPEAQYPKKMFHKFFPIWGFNKVVRGKKPSFFSGGSPDKSIRLSFTNVSRHDICAFAFEPNPEQREHLAVVEKELNDAGHYVRIFNIGLSNYTGLNIRSDDKPYCMTIVHAGSFTFYKMPNQNEKGQVGFSGFKRVKGADKYAIKVELLSIGEFVATLMKNVDIGSEAAIRKCNEAGDPAPAMIAKFDPEGYEYVLIRTLLMQGLLCEFTAITAEWHHKKKMCSVKDCPAFVHQLGGAVALLQEDPACRFYGGFSTFDDESYDVGY